MRYDYKCTNCGKIFEVNQRLDEDKPTFCPFCKKSGETLLERQYRSVPGLKFVGSGFYCNDYPNNNQKGD